MSLTIRNPRRQDRISGPEEIHAYKETLMVEEVHPDLSQLRQDEIAARLHDIRNVSVPGDLLDHLIVAEKYLIQAPSIPATAFPLFYNVLPAHLAQKVSRLHRCAEAVMHLKVIRHLYHPGNMNINSIEVSIRIYYDELQRLLGSLFASDHSFWAQYHVRNHAEAGLIMQHDKSCSQEQALQHLSKITGTYFAGFDALYFLAGRGESATFQLISHSIKWALYAYYTPHSIVGFSRTEALRNAIQLIESLDLPVYREWLVHQVHFSSIPS